MKPKPTKQTDLEGNVIKEYKSLSEASRETGIPTGTIQTAQKFGHVTRKLYRWI